MQKICLKESIVTTAESGGKQDYENRGRSNGENAGVNLGSMGGPEKGVKGP